MEERFGGAISWRGCREKNAIELVEDEQGLDLRDMMDSLMQMMQRGN